MGRIDMRQLYEMLYSLWTLTLKQFWSEKIRSEISDGTPYIAVVKKNRLKIGQFIAPEKCEFLQSF